MRDGEGARRHREQRDDRRDNHHSTHRYAPQLHPTPVMQDNREYNPRQLKTSRCAAGWFRAPGMEGHGDQVADTVNALPETLISERARRAGSARLGNPRSSAGKISFYAGFPDPASLPKHDI